MHISEKKHRNEIADRIGIHLGISRQDIGLQEVFEFGTTIDDISGRIISTDAGQLLDYSDR